MIDLVTPAELAAQLKIPDKTLTTWRYRNKGPKFIKVGKHIRYDPRDVDAWLADNKS